MELQTGVRVPREAGRRSVRQSEHLAKVKGTVGKVVTLHDSSEDEGYQVKTIPVKRKASETESTGP